MLLNPPQSSARATAPPATRRSSASGSASRSSPGSSRPSSTSTSRAREAGPGRHDFEKIHDKQLNAHVVVVQGKLKLKPMDTSPAVKLAKVLG